MFAVICIPDFALQAVLRHEADWRLRPVALIDAAAANAAKALVLQGTATARDAGVCAGLAVPQAMARCHELVLKMRSVSAEQSATDILLQTAYAFSPNIENTAPGVCTIDLRGLNFQDSGRGNEARFERGIENQSLLTSADTEPNRGGEGQASFGFLKETPECSPSSCGWGRNKGETSAIHEWSKSIITVLRQCQLDAQIGIALTPNLARLAAQVAKPVRLIDQLGDFFASLPMGALDPAPELLGILKRWGIHTAEAFFALGREAVAERLGVAALDLFERVSTQTTRPLNMVVPADTFEERMEFEVEIETIEPLLFVLRRFVEQLATRIALNYRVVAELHLRLVLSSGEVYERLFRIPAPTAHVETLFRMLHTHLENLHTEAPIGSLRLSATPARAGHQQFGLFESALRDPNHFHETLARLVALLGADRVGTPMVEATHRPDSFHMAVPQFDGARASGPRDSLPATGGGQGQRAAGLCLRRFRPPLHADVELRDGKPAFVGTLGFSSPVVRSRGPWCASGHWWDNRRWLRQEWDVEMRDGAVFRLYHANNDWLVEGVYD